MLLEKIIEYCSSISINLQKKLKRLKKKKKSKKYQDYVSLREILFFLFLSYLKLVKRIIIDEIYWSLLYKYVIQKIWIIVSFEGSRIIINGLTNYKKLYPQYQTKFFNLWLRYLQKPSTVKIRSRSLIKINKDINIFRLQNKNWLDYLIYPLLFNSYFYLFGYWGWVFIYDLYACLYTTFTLFAYPGCRYVREYFFCPDIFTKFFKYGYVGNYTDNSTLFDFENFMMQHYLSLFYMLHIIFVTSSYLQLRSIFFHIHQAYMDALFEWPLLSYLNLQIQQNPYHLDYYNKYLNNIIIEVNEPFRLKKKKFQKKEKKAFLLLSDLQWDLFDARSYLIQHYFSRFEQHSQELFLSISNIIVGSLMMLFVYWLCPFFLTLFIWLMLVRSKELVVQFPLHGQTMPEYIAFQEFLISLDMSPDVWAEYELDDIIAADKAYAESEKKVNAYYEASLLKVRVIELKEKRKLFFHNLWLDCKKFVKTFNVSVLEPELEIIRFNNPVKVDIFMYIYLAFKEEFPIFLHNKKNYLKQFLINYGNFNWLIFFLDNSLFQNIRIFKYCRLMLIICQKKIKKKIIQPLILFGEKEGGFGYSNLLAHYLVVLTVITTYIRTKILGVLYYIILTIEVYDPRTDHDAKEEAEGRADILRDDYHNGLIKNVRRYRNTSLEDSLAVSQKAIIKDNKLIIEGEEQDELGDHELPLYLTEDNEILVLDDDVVSELSNANLHSSKKNNIYVDVETEIDEERIETTGDTTVEEYNVSGLDSNKLLIVEEHPQENLNNYFEIIYKQVLLHTCSFLLFFFLGVLNLFYGFDQEKIAFFFFDFFLISELYDWSAQISGNLYIAEVSLVDYCIDDAFITENYDNIFGTLSSNVFGFLLETWYSFIDYIAESDDELEYLNNEIQDAIAQILSDFYVIFDTLFYFIEKFIYLVLNFFQISKESINFLYSAGLFLKKLIIYIFNTF